MLVNVVNVGVLFCEKFLGKPKRDVAFWLLSVGHICLISCGFCKFVFAHADREIQLPLPIYPCGF